MEEYHMLFDSIVMEKYVGDGDKRFKEIDKLLGKMSEKINENYSSVLSDIENSKLQKPKFTHYEINQSVENKRIEKLYCEMFGLKEFQLRWDVSMIANASTMTRTLTMFDKQTRENGVHKNSKLMISIHINTALFTHNRMTPREVNAIILHEIGHNFYNSVFQLLARIPVNLAIGADINVLAKAVPATLMTILMSDVLKIQHFMDKISDAISKIFNRFPVVDKFINKTSLVIEEILDLMRFTRKLKWLFGGIVISPAVMAKVAVLNMFSFRYLFLYNVEKHADSFAVDYGYGMELASALNKLDNQKNSMVGYLREYAPFEIAHDIAAIQDEIFATVYSGYPSQQNRIVTGLDRLKRAQNDPSLTPEMRKALQEDIKLYEDFYRNHYLSIDRAKEGKVLTWTYRVIIDKLFNGKMDMRELLHAIDPKKYN